MIACPSCYAKGLEKAVLDTAQGVFGGGVQMYRCNRCGYVGPMYVEYNDAAELKILKKEAQEEGVDEKGNDVEKFKDEVRVESERFNVWKAVALFFIAGYAMYVLFGTYLVGLALAAIFAVWYFFLRDKPD